MDDGTTFVLVRWFCTSSTKICCSHCHNSTLPSTAAGLRKQSLTIGISLYITCFSLACRSSSEPYSSRMSITSKKLTRKTKITKMYPLLKHSSNKKTVYLINTKPTNISTDSSPRFTLLGKKIAFLMQETMPHGWPKHWSNPSLSFSLHFTWSATCLLIAMGSTLTTGSLDSRSIHLWF